MPGGSGPARLSRHQDDPLGPSVPEYLPSSIPHSPSPSQSSEDCASRENISSISPSASPLSRVRPSTWSESPVQGERVKSETAPASRASGVGSRQGQHRGPSPGKGGVEEVALGEEAVKRDRRGL